MRQYVVDAFTDRVFAGNPAAVCVMDRWVPDELMQSIAMENRFSETAFTVREDGGYRLRWFTPGGEIDLYGHATLATASVLLSRYDRDAPAVSFDTLSGPLVVRRDGDRYEMEFPAYEIRQVPVTNEMEAAFGARPMEAWMSRDLTCVFDREADVRAMDPDQDRLAQLPGLLQHATARGADYDCVTRSFAPKLAVPEDPVCGSAHCSVIPYWTRTLGDELTAYQASPRGGVLYCRLAGQKVYIAGKAALYSVGELTVA